MKIQPSASYEIYPNAALISEYLAQQLDAKSRGNSEAALRDWANEPDAMFAQAWFEAVGFKS